MDGTSAFNTRTVGEDISSFLIQQGEGEVDGDLAARRHGGGSSGDHGRASPSSARGRGRRQGLFVLLPCASPLYIGVEGAGFLPSKAKVGGRNPIISLPHRLLSPFFRDLDLIPSGYDLIPSKVGSWCALTRGVGPCPHYPRSCGSPHAGGPHFGTF